MSKPTLEASDPDERLTIVELFAGIGGMRIGFDAVGARCVFASEIDRFARESYSANFGEEPAGDITKISAEDIPDHDILTAGFPCQPFSIAGVSKKASLGREHGFRDATRGTLFFDVARIIEHKRPRAFLLENVKNLRSHDRGRTFEIIESTLKSLGYTVDSQVIDARWWVPQHRERVFIVGFRDEADAARFRWPQPPDVTPKLASILDAEVPEKYTLSDKLWKYLQDYAAKHRARGNGFGFGLADRQGTTRTLSARYYKDGSEILIPQPGMNPRRLTPVECGRLMGFPSSYKIRVSDTQAYKQFGNAVVPGVIAALAKSMRMALE